jgi:hypothetical protein
VSLYTNAFNQLTAQNNKVIVVAHSRGNLYTNQAYAGLNKPLLFSMISVATPAGNVSGNGPYTTVFGDAILNVSGRLNPNTDNNDGCDSVNPLLNILSAINCHLFNTSYINNPKVAGTLLSREKILDGIEAALPVVLNVTYSGAGTGTIVSTTSSPYLPASGFTCDQSCSPYSAAYDGGTNVTIEAHPASGSRFAGWTGDCNANSLGAQKDLPDGGSSVTFPVFLYQSGTVITSYPESCTAKFEKIMLSVRLSPFGRKSISDEPYMIQLVDDQLNQVAAPQDIEVDVDRSVTSGCSGPLFDRTDKILIPQGQKVAILSDLAGHDPACPAVGIMTTWQVLTATLKGGTSDEATLDLSGIPAPQLTLSVVH